jgi:hypothetical protein
MVSVLRKSVARGWESTKASSPRRAIRQGLDITALVELRGLEPLTF